MVSLEEVERQLKVIETNFRFWGRSEMLELQHILIPGEQIQVCLNGRYEGGFAMLCATDQRLLLVDKKPLYLTMEDVRYDMVSEVDYSHRLVDATVRVCTPMKTLRFTTWRRIELRKMTNYLQQRVIEIRQRHAFEAQVEQQVLQQQPQPQFQQQLQPAAVQAPVQVVATPAPAATASRPAPLPMPGFINPYYQSPLMMRKRISRFYPRSRQ